VEQSVLPLPERFTARQEDLLAAILEEPGVAESLEDIAEEGI
jgi:hypothetical protein